LHYVFIGERLSKDEQEAILKHEMVHVAQKHSLDLLYFELLRIVFWFNPLVYMYQNRIRSLHEFIADKEALKTQEKQAYYQSLLAQVFETQNVSFVNTFFKKSLIKKRIVMLQKNRSEKINLLKYLFLVPMVIGMLIYTSAEAQNNQINSNEIYQDLTDKQLKEKFHKELLELKKSGASVFEISDAFKPKGDLYVISREAYYRNHVYYEYMLSLGEASVKDLKKELNTSYREYLNYKKTDEAKLNWESNIKDGNLRLVVNDLENLTEKEKQKKAKKIDLIKKDDYLHALRIENADGGKIHMQSHSSILSANKRDDSNGVLINSPSVDVGFDVVDKVPIFPGCEGLSNKDLKKCLTESVSNHIAENFSTKVTNKLGLMGKQRIHVIFKIDAEGNTTGIKARASHSALEMEAVRVINTFPKMIPGMHKGKNVTVPYSLPIVFDVQNETERKASDVIPLNEVEVPFTVVEEVPVFLGCETLQTNDEKKECLVNGVTKHIEKSFNTDIANKLGLVGRQRISVLFKINKEGLIEGVRARAPHPDLEAEAIRVVQNLPKMQPGKQRGKVVTVPYSLPIVFQVQDDSSMDTLELKEKTEENTKVEEDVAVPFAVVEEVPIFPGCEDLETNAERRKCMSNKISSFVAKKFNTSIADSLGFKGRQRISVIFKINKEGNVDEIRARSSSLELEEEAVRVIKTLPKMKPGVQRGKVVSVPYSLPIVFEVEDTQMLDETIVVGYADDTLGGTVLPVATFDKAPILPECKSLESEKEKRKCTSTGVQKHVNRNFNTNLASQLGLKGRQRINIVFKITKKGKIEIEKTMASHPDLEAEAIRVIKSMPKLIPGKHKGKKVDVLYSLPIIFQVQD
jgi:outer membrane biosynthesis protein TonB